MALWKRDHPLTSCHYSCDGLRQGDLLATIYFNIIATRIYRKHMATIDGREVHFAIADDVKIATPPEVFGDVGETFPAIAWNKASLTTHTIKIKIHVQPSVRAVWVHYMNLTTMSP